jgi:2-dehydro-3-deoxyphosphogluconate aldolase/(4S)-4-hydroxy-2-oxoglutarate aldolase
MNRKALVQAMETHRLVAVVRARTAEQALGAARAAIEGGLHLIEITFTVPDAPVVIEELSREGRADLLVGAGSVTLAEQAKIALGAGARFVVSPIKQTELLRVCHQVGAPCILGALTPTEIVEAYRAGADLVKVFPITLIGGPRFIKELLAPLPGLPLMVSGGVNLDNFQEYLAAGVRSVALGGDLIQPQAMEASDYQTIARRARQYQEALASWQEAHP